HHHPQFVEEAGHEQEPALAAPQFVQGFQLVKKGYRQVGHPPQVVLIQVVVFDQVVGVVQEYVEQNGIPGIEIPEEKPVPDAAGTDHELGALGRLQQAINDAQSGYNKIGPGLLQTMHLAPTGQVHGAEPAVEL